ncbi:MAG: hypothetical protein K8T89_12715 [Planctomycetes bacterium]|nr:hypothetical protein [Planctomycetota bacterium]
MKLHTQSLPQVRQLLRQGGWFTPSVVVSVLALEFFGRQSANDFYDTVGAASLVLLVALVAIRHRSVPLDWVKYLGRQVWKLSRCSDYFKIEFGPDLRGTPPIPRALPISVHVTIVVLTLWTAGALALWNYLPNSWRSYAIQGSYTLYLVGMIALWGMLFAGALGGIYFPFMLFNYLFPRASARTEDPKMSRGQLGFLTLYVVGVVLASWALPLWIVPAFCGVVLAIATMLALWPRWPDVQFIWRSEHSRRVWSVTSPRLLWLTSTLIILALLAIISMAAGGRMLGKAGSDADMPLTVMLGAAVAWLTPGILISGGTFAFVLWRNNPSRTCKPSVYVAGPLALAALPRVQQLLHNQGFNVHVEPSDASEIDVGVRLVESVHSQAREFDPAWPLCVSLEDLADAQLRDRLVRRDEIQKRRLFLRGLEKIFKHVKGHEHAGGSGFWLAPHLWFMPGLARDEMDEERDDAAFLAQTVGPPYHEVMHRHVRQYVYHLLRALQVDLIFIEDGIDYRKLKKVLRVLFEVYDKSAGQKRAEENHFVGMPKMKVLIHDFQLDEPFRSENYPEPRFEDLGRARILHIFRDRGDQDEYIEPPFDFDRSPVPLYV